MKIRSKLFILALALGSCVSSVSFSVAQDNYDRGTFKPRAKPPKPDYNGWKGDEHFYAVVALNNNSTVLDFPSGASADGNSHGYQLGLGYNFNENLAVEISLNEFGEITERSDSGEAKVDFSNHSIDLALVGKMPIVPNWVAFGKLGVSNWQSQLDLAGIPQTAHNFFRASDSGTNMFVGAGVSYGLTRYVDIFGEIDYRDFKPVFDNTEYDTSISTLLIGFKFTFGKAKNLRNGRLR